MDLLNRSCARTNKITVDARFGTVFDQVCGSAETAHPRLVKIAYGVSCFIRYFFGIYVTMCVDYILIDLNKRI